MKKITFIYFALIFSISLLQAGTIANVTVHKNLLLTIDRGASDGVESGMKGIVKAVYKEPSGEYTINIGIFTVKKLFPRSAEVLIEIGKGLNPDDARYVVFDKDLVPRESKTDPVVEAKPESTVPAKPIENIDSLLEQGDAEAEAGNVNAALGLYKKALAQAPGNLIAKEKYNEMQKKIDTAARKDKFNDYLIKSAANYEKNDVKFSFLYLIEGLRIFPEGSAEVKERLSVMNREYPREIDAILTEKAVELKDVRKQIDAMLERTAPEKEAPTAVKPAPAAVKPAAAAVPAKPPAAKFSEPFLQNIAGKAEKIRKNEKGFWEATFPHKITMIHIPAGEFTIGSPDGEGGDDEHPAHKVFISGYWIGKTEVTFAQFDAFCQETGLEKPADEGWGRGERPVIYVSWQEANDFCAWLKKKTGLDFRLLTEAEWEKAARDRYPWGSAEPESGFANFNQELMKTEAVGSYPEGASPFGVLDMAGNVWEWLADWYAADYYENSADSDPLGPEEGEERVVRGGSWDNDAESIRSAVRGQENPENKVNIIGFRLALSGQ
jgi:formylglycine-generating enzyme required for sulfatase activity